MTISFFFVLGEDITGYHKKAMVTDDCLGDRRGSGGEVDSYGYVVVVKIRRKKKNKKFSCFPVCGLTIRKQLRWRRTSLLSQTETKNK